MPETKEQGAGRKNQLMQIVDDIFYTHYTCYTWPEEEKGYGGIEMRKNQDMGNMV